MKFARSRDNVSRPSDRAISTKKPITAVAAHAKQAACTEAKIRSGPASGRTAPRVFVLRNEHAINALTAGRHSEDAVLVLTRGCLDRLTRDELQGVVAHEFSHLLHGDTALDARLVAMLSGLLFIPDAGIDLLRAGWSGGADRRPHEPATGPTPLLVLALILVIWS